nr:nucleotidyltransferase family protein [Ramlibacter tataouinensis]
MVTPERFIADALQNRHVRAILARWERLELQDGWLVAGCLFQTVWNLLDGGPAEAGIKDYDIFYFDDSDLGEAAEVRVQDRVSCVLSDLGIVVEATNQARVHLWYEQHFGHPYPRLSDSREGIELYAPHGLDMLYQGILTPNTLTDHRLLFRRKAASYRGRWPWLKVVEPS